ncbi:MAG: hypothetical protein [Circular genetic element sp.]|nr:MAG: hypothetical protein [Circular genetic element sp.]
MPAIPCRQPQYTFYIVTVTAREGTSKELFANTVTGWLRKHSQDAKVACVKERYPNPDRTKHFVWPDGECYHYHLVYHCIKSGRPVRSRWKKLWKFLNQTDYAHSSFFTLRPKKGEDASVVFRAYIEDPKKRKEVDVEGVYEVAPSVNPARDRALRYMMACMLDPTLCRCCGPQYGTPPDRFALRIAAERGCEKCKAKLLE